MKRDIGQEILDGIRAIKKGHWKRFVVKEPGPVTDIREKLGKVFFKVHRYHPPATPGMVWLGVKAYHDGRLKN